MVSRGRHGTEQPAVEEQDSFQQFGEEEDGLEKWLDETGEAGRRSREEGHPQGERRSASTNSTGGED